MKSTQECVEITEICEKIREINGFTKPLISRIFCRDSMKSTDECAWKSRKFVKSS